MPFPFKLMKILCIFLSVVVYAFSTGPEAGLPSRQLASGLLQAARILRCQRLPRRGGFVHFFVRFIIFPFSARPLADQLFWSVGVWAKVVGLVWQGRGDGDWGWIVIQQRMQSIYFCPHFLDLFVFVVSNYALLPRPGRLWNTQLDSHTLLHWGQLLQKIETTYFERA